MQVVPLPGAVDADGGVVLNHLRREDVEADSVSLELELDGVEGPGGVGPIQRADEALISVRQDLAAHSQRHRRLFIADPGVGLAQVEPVTEDSDVRQAVADARSAGILALKPELQPGGRCDPQVQTGPDETVSVVIPLPVPQAPAALEAATELAGKRYPTWELVPHAAFSRCRRLFRIFFLIVAAAGSSRQRQRPDDAGQHNPLEQKGKTRNVPQTGDSRVSAGVIFAIRVRTRSACARMHATPQPRRFRQSAGKSENSLIANLHCYLRALQHLSPAGDQPPGVRPVLGSRVTIPEPVALFLPFQRH